MSKPLYKKLFFGLLTIFTVALLAFTLSACSAQEAKDSADAYEDAESAAGGSTGTVGVGEEDASVDMTNVVDTNIIGLAGPTGIGMVKMMDDAAQAGSSPFHFTLVSAPDQATAAIINGEADIAAVPTNLAATLYNRLDGGVEMIAINCLGNLYIVELGDTIHSIADLRGQTIYATGQGSNPQYILEHLLRQAGLEPGTDVTIEYLSEHAELATLVASGERTLAMLPEPFVATALSRNSDAHIVLNLNDVWTSQNSGEMTMGCVIVRTDFLNEHPETVEAFLKQLHSSIDYALSDVDGTAELCVQYGIMNDASIAKSAIPNCAITFIDGEDMQPAIADYFKVLYDANANSLGGSIPAENFYYTANTETSE